MAAVTSPLSLRGHDVIDYSTSPVSDPPTTEFPYPESPSANEPHSRPISQRRLDSDATLRNDSPAADQVDPGDVGNRNQTSAEAPGARPTWRVRKYDTELVNPVSGRPFAAFTRRSTGARPSGQAFERPTGTKDGNRRAQTQTSSDSSSSSESEGEGAAPSKFKQLPSPHALSKGHLNHTKKANHKSRFSIGNEDFKTRGKVAKDGRLNISLNEKANSGYLAKALGATLQSHLNPNSKQAAKDAEAIKEQYKANKTNTVIPKLNIVIMVIGSRGDIQPFLRIGRILQDKYHHRVRIATHPAFKKFVEEDIGLEFFSVGGDPSELMSFMVKNPGLVPSFETVKAGEIGKRREQMFEMFQGFWRACINATDDEKDVTNLKMLGKKSPFVADAIIANPPSFAHFHCAEKLGIPLHLVFTFPYSPTSAFPHPLANIKASNVDREYTNYMSYPLVELMTWQGLGDLVNRFRVKTLGLEPVSTLWAPGQAARLKIPTTYLWSPGLVPKPADWGPEIDIAGYVFLDLASSYKPPQDLDNFLSRTTDDRPLLYIGFGSISGLDDPRAFCQMIFDAVAKADVRAVISRGWGGMGDGLDRPDGVFLLDNVPHDWLFPKVDAVVHHGGAGTTAAGLKFGKPTMIVPFFGDQPFWAQMIAKAGAGARQALPLKKLDSDKFAEGILQCLTDEAREKTQEIARSIAEEGDGAENAVDSFHRALPLSGKHSMQCGIFEDRVAVWRVKHTGLQLSALAADLLVESRQISWSDLQFCQHKDWTDFSGPGEPITGAGGAVLGTFHETIYGLSSIKDMVRSDMQRKERRKRKGKTVADVVLMSAHAATQARSHEEPDSLKKADTPINLHGEAEPPRVPGVVGHTVTHNSLRPVQGRSDTTQTTGSALLPTPLFVVRDVGRGVGHSVKAIVLMPLDIMNAITLGLRNAPRLYGDRTVRKPPHTVTGFRDGWKTAGRELWFGLYDGIVGVVKIPTMDVHAGGMKALPKGMARGIGGLILKPTAGFLGVPTYSGRGCVALIRKQFRDTTKLERWLRKARMNQGAKDVQELKNQRSKIRTTPDGHLARHDGDLEDVRSTALTRWTTHEQQLVQEARAHDHSMTEPQAKPSRARTT